MRHEVVGTYSDKVEQHNINLVVYGEPGNYSAMAMSVGYPCAIAARMILKGNLSYQKPSGNGQFFLKFFFPA